MLNDLKLLLGFENDESNDAKLNVILKHTTARLKVLIGGIEPPEELQHIIVDVSIKRFNRIGSEGMTAHSVEGESLTFADDDFSEFADEIQAFLAAQEEATRGKVRFI